MLWRPAGLAVPGTDVVSSGSLLTFQPWEEQGENEQDDIEKPPPPPCTGSGAVRAMCGSSFSYHVSCTM